MNMLLEIVSCPQKYDVSDRACDELLYLYESFKRNPFFPTSKKDYARSYLNDLYRKNVISANLMQQILSDF